MGTRKYIVRIVGLGLVGTALAFAHPTDVHHVGPTGPRALRQEEPPSVQFRMDTAAATPGSVQAGTLSHDEEMRQEKLMHRAFRIATRPATRRRCAHVDCVRLEL